MKQSTKKDVFDQIVNLCICSAWGILTIFLFMSGEAIFILPASFIAFTIFHLISSLKSHVSRLKIARSLVWYICFSLFSYLSARSPQAKPFFPLLCITISLWMMLRPLKFPAGYSTLLFSTWIFCMPVASISGGKEVKKKGVCAGSLPVSIWWRIAPKL